MLYQHPETYLAMWEQDRERAMAQRALERAARSGGEQHAGLARGGISSFARFLRDVGSAVVNFHIGDSSPTARHTGSQGA